MQQPRTVQPLALPWPLHPAVLLAGHLPTVQALLRGGAPPNHGSAWGPWGLLRTESPLYAAAAAGQESVVRALLQAGADPTAGRRRPASFLSMHVRPL